MIGEVTKGRLATQASASTAGLTPSACASSISLARIVSSFPVPTFSTSPTVSVRPRTVVSLVADLPRPEPAR